jgi:hypothetical protein
MKSFATPAVAAINASIGVNLWGCEKWGEQYGDNVTTHLDVTR